MPINTLDPTSYENGFVEVTPYLRTSVRGVPHPVRRHQRRQRWGMRVRYNPEVLYHLAPEDEVEEILKKGLLPGGKAPFANFEHLPKRTRGRVFMVPTEADLRNVQGYMPRSRSAILRVDTHGIPLYEGENKNPRFQIPELTYNGETDKVDLEVPPQRHVEYFATRRIPPERIRVVGSMGRSRKSGTGRGSDEWVHD
jgi:hypothetical protein